ncbi:MAG: hypothetical protein WCR46_05350 [Deltaproteobacteria bacterium]
MKNNGLFSSLFIENLKERVALDDAAQGRMATLAQTWHVRKDQDAESLWESFLKKALSYLEFIPSGRPDAPGVYPLYEDWGFTECVSVLYLAPPGSDIDDSTVGRFYPAKLIARLKERKLNWGILTDGSRWRLYSTKSSRPFEDYVELSLAETLEGSDEAEYGLFERFFHRDSFVVDLSAEARYLAGEAEDTKETGSDKSAGIYKCRLDHDREQSEQVLDERVKKPFLAQVDEVLQYICNGFIFDTQKSGEEYTEKERAEIFESAVKLIYRCLFLFYAEARRLIPTDLDKADLYLRHSIQALCQEAHKFRWGKRRDTDQYDLWKHLKGLINAVNDGDPEYGIMGYNGGLFDDEEERFLGQHQLRNDFLYRALYLLAFVEPFDNEPDGEYLIPYSDLEVRHLGELHETILEYTVQLADADRIRRRTKKGVEILLVSQTQKKAGDTSIKKGDVYFGESALERKQTGSYYTPESLVRFLNEKTIIHPLSEIFEQKYRQRFNALLEQAINGHDIGARRGAAQSAAVLVERFAEDELLKFKVCDLAMGSGHFLVDAANQMAGLVVSLFAEVETFRITNYELGITNEQGKKGDNNSSFVIPNSSLNAWRRRITRHCIYGVDLNPLAVNLAKLSLWLNCFATHHRLTFLDHHVRCGNSLIGIRSLKQLATVPDRKKDGKKKKDDKVRKLFPNFQEYAAVLTEAGQDVQSISAMDEDETGEQKSVFDRAQQKVVLLKSLADLYTSYLMDGGIRPDDYYELFYSLVKKEKINNPLNPDLPKFLETVEIYQDRHHFFHWPFEFPDVFGPDAVGGFSANIGNPPWDIVKPNSQEFFSDYDSRFRSYDKQKANRESAKLTADNPIIAEKWEQYCNGFSEQSAYFKEPVSYCALGKGDINTFKLFLEQFFTLLHDGGRMGIVVPSGIYTDQGCQPLRELFFSRSSIEFLYCFENRWPTVFSAVDGRFKFVTFGMQKGGSTDWFKCAFMEHDPERLPVIDADALKMSMKQVKKFSPNSLAIMELKSQRDVDIITLIYGDLPLLGEKVEEGWNVKLRMGDYHLTNDSHKFNRIEDLLGSIPTSTEELIIKLLEHNHYPVYEGKNCWFYDSNISLPTLCVEKMHTNGISFNVPRIGFRRIAASTNERTLIPCVIPGKSLCTYGIIFADDNADVPLTFTERVFYAGIIGCFSLDFILRFQISTSISNSNGYSLPILRTHAGTKEFEALVYRICRLISTTGEFSDLWNLVFDSKWQSPDFCYPSSAPIDGYGPAHEQAIRRRLRDEAKNLTPEWGPHCGVHDRLPDRRDTGDRAQLRAEIDAYVAHLYGLSRDDFAYILDTFPVLKKKEKKAFGEFMSKRKCLEEYDRVGKIINAEL